MALKIRHHLEAFSANQCGTRIVIRASLTAIRNEVENESDSLIREDWGVKIQYLSFLA